MQSNVSIITSCQSCMVTQRFKHISDATWRPEVALICKIFSTAPALHYSRRCVWETLWSSDLFGLEKRVLQCKHESAGPIWFFGCKPPLTGGSLSYFCCCSRLTSDSEEERWTAVQLKGVMLFKITVKVCGISSLLCLILQNRMDSKWRSKQIKHNNNNNTYMLMSRHKPLDIVPNWI